MPPRCSGWALNENSTAVSRKLKLFTATGSGRIIKPIGSINFRMRMIYEISGIDAIGGDRTFLFSLEGIIYYIFYDNLERLRILGTLFCN